MNKRYRLKKSTEISLLVQSRIRVSSKFYNLYYANNQSDVKIAIVCGKKCGGAVSRNYEKRVMREIMKRYIKDLSGFHIVLVAKPTVITESFSEKEKDLDYLVKRLKKGQKINEK